MSRDDHRPTGLERAYEMARSGRFDTIEHLIKALNREGYSGEATLNGRQLRRDLVALMRAPKTEAEVTAEPDASPSPGSQRPASVR